MALQDLTQFEPTVDVEVLALGKVYRLPGDTRYWQTPLSSKQVAAIKTGGPPVVIAPADGGNYWLLLRVSAGR